MKSNNLNNSGPIAIGSDHAGFKLKEAVKSYLKTLKIDFYDFGTYSEESVDYPDYGYKVAKAVSSKKFKRGILICGTGVGISIAANKIAGIRAALCHDTNTAYFSRTHVDSNILVLGGRTTSTSLAKKIVYTWLTTEFEGGRHRRRIKKIEKIEKHTIKDL